MNQCKGIFPYGQPIVEVGLLSITIYSSKGCVAAQEHTSAATSCILDKALFAYPGC